MSSLSSQSGGEDQDNETFDDLGDFDHNGHDDDDEDNSDDMHQLLKPWSSQLLLYASLFNKQYDGDNFIDWVDFEDQSYDDDDGNDDDAYDNVDYWENLFLSPSSLPAMLQLQISPSSI